jgi:hypothetical protein
LFATLAVALDAVARLETNWIWLIAMAIAPAFLVAFALRPAFAAAAEGPTRKIHEAPFSMLLGAAVASFFCISTGVAPGWLYGFLPSEMSYQPLSLSHLALQLEVLGAAGLAYATIWALGLSPRDSSLWLWDVDAFYRGPLASLARWVGIIMLRLYGSAQEGVARLRNAGSSAVSVLVRRLDRPYAPNAFAWGPFALVGLVLLVVMLFRGV